MARTNELAVTVFFLVAVGLVVFGAPVLTAFLTASVGYLLLEGIDPRTAVKVMLDGTSSFILLAVPMFIFVANLFEIGSISDRLFNFANRMVGHLPGGTSHVNILNSVIFSGMSGSAVADTSGIGAISARAMIKDGFPPPYAAAVTINSAVIGPIIPPSIPALIIASVTDVSVGALFMAGVMPGLLLAGLMFSYCYIVAVRRNYPKSGWATAGVRLRALQRAALPLMIPIILIGGIYSGVFTPTEAAAVAALYVLALCFLYRDGVTLPSLVRCIMLTVYQSAAILLLVASVSMVAWIVTVERIPQDVATFVLAYNFTPMAFLAILTLLLLMLGALLPTEVVIFLFVPIVFAPAVAVGIDPIHFCIIALVNLMIGLNTPPFGLQLFVSSSVLNVPVGAIIRESIGMLLALGFGLLLIVCFPQIVLFLPQTMMR